MNKLGVVNGVMVLPEVATPVPLTNHGKVYTKDDNKLYFQDGAGNEHELGEAGGASAGYAEAPGHYTQDISWANKGSGAAADRRTLVSPNRISVNIDDKGYYLESQQELDLNDSDSWDTTEGTDYTVAANRAGVDFYIYACQPASGVVPVILVSDSSTFPVGYTADNSRKIGGFHGLCVAVGAIGGHTLTGYLAGDILPTSVWNLRHRPVASPEGMVFDEAINEWADIYLSSGTGASTASVNGGTITNTRDWNSFVDDGHAVKKRLATDEEFQSLAAGSNEETNINGSADPVTTGGHSDTAGRRMISNKGGEDFCGAMWQWLQTPSVRLDDGTIFQNVNLPGAKGTFDTYGNSGYGNTQLRAGGSWGNGTNCGSQGRTADHSRLRTSTSSGGRFLSEPKEVTLS